MVFILSTFGILDGAIIKMSGGEDNVNQGPHRDSAGPSSVPNSESDSGSWRKYLNLSSDKEGNAESESSKGHTPGHQPQGGGAPGQPTGVMGPEEPSLSFLREKIVLVVRSFGTGTRMPRSNFLKRIEEDLWSQKRLKIAQVLEELSTNRDPLVNSGTGKRLADELTVMVYDWEREQGHYKNSFHDDVP